MDTQSKWFDIGAAGVGAVGGLVGKIGQKKRERRQFKRTKELMDIQQQNQMALNEQGQSLAMKTWQETNYPAQIKMLEEAGLNPALLYGMGGAGGSTTASGSGGGASMGSPPPVENIPMDINAALGSAKIAKELALLTAQKENVDADTTKKKTEANKIGGVDTDLVSAQIGLIAEQTKNETAKRRLINAQEESVKLENYITNASKEDQIDEIKWTARTALYNMNIAKNEDKKLNETIDSQISEIKSNAIGAAIANVAAIKGIQLDNARIVEIGHGIVQKYESLDQGWVSLSQKQKELKIKEFEAEVKAEYPSMSGVSGGAIMSVLDLFGIIDNKMYGTEKRRTKVNQR